MLPVSERHPVGAHVYASATDEECFEMTAPTASFGLWPSPLSPTNLSRGKRLSDVSWDTDGQTLVWLEGRSDRGVLVCAQKGDAPRDLTVELSVRARVGYGGGDMTAAQNKVYFASGGQLYRRSLAPDAPHAITPPFGDAASPAVSPDGRWLIYVHTDNQTDALAIVDTDGKLWPQKLVVGDDFYMQPTWHPDGGRVAWISWDHPRMPWDGTTLCLATLAPGEGTAPTVARRCVVAGGHETAIAQPEFSPDGRYLAYISDESGWDGLYLYDLGDDSHRALVGGEFEIGSPAWVQGVRTFGWAPDSRTIYYTRNDRGFESIWAVDVATGETQKLDALAEYTSFSQLVVSSRGELAMVVSSPVCSARVLAHNPEKGTSRVVARATDESLPPEILSAPEAITWRSKEGDEVHGLYYAPVAGRFASTGKPPLIVSVHGGPTSQSMATYNSKVQFFTTRGYACLDVNYRGSTGYGRDYRNKLYEQWGIYDVDDAVGGARYLAGQGLVDPEKMVIMGGSAGGYAVLQALIRYPGTFKAGLCLYGVTNLFTLAADTHKFEQHYLDYMVGPLPEMSKRYHDRSPVFYADRIVDPLAVFQGEIDRVVPLAQAETIVKALQRSGVPHEYHVYAGEGHGWRRADTIASFYETVQKFLRQYVLYA